MKSLEISNEQSLPYKFLLKKHKTVFYNSLILLNLYKTNQQKLKIYNTLTIKFYGTGYVDFAYHTILQNTLSLKAKLPERELRKAAEPLCDIHKKLLQK